MRRESQDHLVRFDDSLEGLTGLVHSCTDSCDLSEQQDAKAGSAKGKARGRNQVQGKLFLRAFRFLSWSHTGNAYVSQQKV